MCCIQVFCVTGYYGTLIENRRRTAKIRTSKPVTHIKNDSYMSHTDRDRDRDREKDRNKEKFIGNTAHTRGTEYLEIASHQNYNSNLNKRIKLLNINYLI